MRGIAYNRASHWGGNDGQVQTQAKPSDLLSGQSGLVFVGAALSHFVDFNALDTHFPKSNGIKLSDVLRNYVGLLATGKSDFDAIESRREDEFFARALDVSQVPSSASLRQRLDEVAEPLKALIDEAPVALLQRAKAAMSPLASGYVPVDIDVFPMDNSASCKEGVSRTYAGFDGYAPIAGYVGEEGWRVGLELRPGSQHSAKDASAFVGRVLSRAVQLTAAPLLLRMDSGFDGAEIILSAAHQAIERLQHGGRSIELLIKANPRSLDVVSLHAAKCSDPGTHGSRRGRASASRHGNTSWCAASGLKRLRCDAFTGSPSAPSSKGKRCWCPKSKSMSGRRACRRQSRR